MDIQTIASVGNVYQNIAFYTFLTIMVLICMELVKHNSKPGRFETPLHNK